MKFLWYTVCVCFCKRFCNKKIPHSTSHTVRDEFIHSRGSTLLERPEGPPLIVRRCIARLAARRRVVSIGPWHPPLAAGAAVSAMPHHHGASRVIRSTLTIAFAAPPVKRKIFSAWARPRRRSCKCAAQAPRRARRRGGRRCFPVQSPCRD